MLNEDISSSIIKLKEEARHAPAYKDYNLSYIIEGNAKIATDEIVKMSSQLKLGKDIVKVCSLNRDGDLYKLVFVKDGVDDKTQQTFVQRLQATNCGIYYNILSGGARTDRQKTGKVLEEHVHFANEVYSIDVNGKPHSLLELPIAEFIDKIDPLSQDTIKKVLNVTKDNCDKDKWGKLKRRILKDESGRRYTQVSLEIAPDFYGNWLKSTKDKSTFSNNIAAMINSVRLDLDQIKNSCEEYNILGADWENNGRVSANNAARIYSKNALSIGIIGNSDFDKLKMFQIYEKSRKGFGNAYPISAMMFLPSEETLIKIRKKLEAMQNETIQKEDVVQNQTRHDREDAFLRSIIELDPNLALSSDVVHVKEMTIGQVISYYSDKIELRKKMNYRDPKQDGKLIRMSNVFDMGYDLEERNEMKKAFGKLGTQLYDRKYALQFANYIMDTYKGTGAIYDLTDLSVMFGSPKEEREEIEKSLKADMKQYTKAQELLKSANIDHYLSYLQRFDCLLNVEIPGRPTTTFGSAADRVIQKQVGSQTVNWVMNPMFHDVEDRGFSNPRKSDSDAAYNEALYKKLQECANSVYSENSDNPGSPLPC